MMVFVVVTVNPFGASPVANATALGFIRTLSRRALTYQGLQRLLEIAEDAAMSADNATDSHAERDRKNARQLIDALETEIDRVETAEEEAIAARQTAPGWTEDVPSVSATER
jgi:hypothetical protein